MGGTSAAMMLHRMIHATYGWRGEFQVCESLQMCAADRADAGDVEEAYACGRRAVELAAEGTSGVMVSIVRNSSNPYRWSLGTRFVSRGRPGREADAGRLHQRGGELRDRAVPGVPQAADRPVARLRPSHRRSRVARAIDEQAPDSILAPARSSRGWSIDADAANDRRLPASWPRRRSVAVQTSIGEGSPMIRQPAHVLGLISWEDLSVCKDVFRSRRTFRMCRLFHQKGWDHSA